MLDPEISPDAKLTYALLRYFCRSDAGCFAKRETLSHHANLSLFRLRNALNELKNSELITIKNRGQGLPDLIHVLDVSNPKIDEYDDAVYEVLKELEAEEKTIITVLNKTDLVDNIQYLKRLEKKFNNTVSVSALKGNGLELIIDKISRLLSELVTEIKVEIPNNRMDKVNLIYENGKVHKREDKAETVYIEATVPVRLRNLLNL